MVIISKVFRTEKAVAGIAPRPLYLSGLSKKSKGRQLGRVATANNPKSESKVFDFFQENVPYTVEGKLIPSIDQANLMRRIYENDILECRGQFHIA